MADCLSSLKTGLLAGLFFSFATTANAAFPQTPPEPFDQSALESTVDIQSAGHLVLFSPVREIRDEIRSENMARLPVQGKGQLFEIARDASLEEARAHYYQRLSSGGASILFECSGMACGRSNVWANQIFQQSRLLGRDATQDYLVAATTDDDGQQWLTLVYTVTRGNLREYVWVEHLAVGFGAAIPGYTVGDGPLQGPIIVPWSGGITFQFDWSADDRRTLNEWAKGDAQVVLASFTEPEAGETLEKALARSREAAESLASLLGKTGVSGSQIRIVPVGPAVKLNDPARQGNRVEIVVIKR
ncbi:DUF4892 domain-containing protein [Marinobacter sp. VGCF2001]|uniref:DUF4892 domain-containing protein n=1 Tax=Marinobacter sp. VGCF2001 TaxID=3417189 RepID=UPI003CE694F2